MIERNPVAAYCVVAWTAALGLVVQGLAKHHPQVLAVAGGVLLALVCGRVVSLAEELRALRSRRGGDLP